MLNYQELNSLKVGDSVGIMIPSTKITMRGIVLRIEDRIITVNVENSSPKYFHISTGKYVYDMFNDIFVKRVKPFLIK